MSYIIDTSSFIMLDGRVRRRVFRTTSDRTYWNEGSPSLSRSFVAFVRKFSDESVTDLKSFALSKYPVQVVLLNFSREYSSWLI